MLRLDDLQVFVYTADHGSLSAAARLLDLSPAVASSALKRLEAVLQFRLFARTTRSLRLSEEGEHYLHHARAALQQLQAGQDALRRGRQELGGVLRLAMPSDLGRHVLLPWLDAFQAAHPAIRLHLHVSDRTADMHRQPVDLALRYGQQDDSTLVAMPVAPANRRVLVAAPAYLRAHGAPASLAELARRNCLRFALDEGMYDRWVFPGQGAPLRISGDRASDDAELVRRWAVAGKGIAYKSRLDVTADLRAGRLQVLLPDVLGEEVPLHLVCLHRSQVTPVVIALRDYLRAQVDGLCDTAPTP